MIQQGQTYSFRQELYLGVHDLSADVLKMALFTANADLPLSTTAYSTSNEVTGTGYVAGGETCQNVTVNISSTGKVYVSFDSLSWTGSFTCRGALIYNSSKSNKSVAILDFGSDKTISSQTLTVTLPANTADSALIRSV